MEEKANINDNTVGVVAYITLIGFIIAIVLNSNKEAGEEKKFGAFHLRQALGLIIFAVGTYIIFAMLTMLLITISLGLAGIVGILSMLIMFGFLALLIMGIINAANKTYKEVPVIGKFSSKILGAAFE